MSGFQKQNLVLTDAILETPALDGDLHLAAGSGDGAGRILVKNYAETVEEIAYMSDLGGGGGGDIFTSLVETPVSITTTATLTSTAFGKLHVISGTTADYTVTLPAVSGNTNKIISFRIAHDATRFFTIKAAGSELIDGLNERVMWQDECATLLCDGSRWIKIAGKSRPLKVTANRGTSQNLSGNTTVTIIFDTLLTDSRESSPIASLFYNTSDGIFTAPRPSVYLCSSFIRLNSDTATYSYNITRAGAARFDNPNIAISRPNGSHQTLNGRWGLGVGHTARCVIFCPSAQSTLTTTGNKPTFAVTEIPEW